MKKIGFVLIFLLSFFAYSQCPQTEELILSSQERVDEFVQNYSTCERIVGNLRIISAVSGVDDFTATGTEVNDISGLNFIKEITGKLIISVGITEISGFSNLTTVGRDIEITNSASLERISGFNNLQQARSITIALNPKLKEIQGFESLSTMNESLEIGFSDALERISGFSSLRSLGGQLNISNNLVLTEIPSFNNLVTISNDLNFTSNPTLMQVDGFNSLELIGNDLNVESIRSLTGFTKLKKITSFVDIRKSTVEIIPSFESLEEVGAGFRISDTGIKEISGFNNLLKVGHIFFLEDWFIVKNNPALNKVQGFGRFILVDGKVEVTNNPLLSDCSWLCNLLNNGEITGDLIIQNNIGDCINALTVIQICDIDFDDDTIADVIDVDDDNDGILDIDEGNRNVDTDGDGYPDSIDLDSDNDGCFDVLEAGFSDPNSDGILGDLPDEVDINGRIINETTGYTTPLDTNNNTIFDFQEISTLDPGKNNIVEFCPSSPIVDLVTLLNGNPEPGGVWSPALISGTGVFDPLNDAPGLYTYTHYDPICGERSAQLIVELPSRNNAGLDAEITICDKDTTVDLFDQLNGNPSPGGSWSPELESGGSIFDSSKDEEGVYVYTVFDRTCGAISSKVNVKKTEKPNSGISSKVSICEFANPINLFYYLGGEPDTNGTWSTTLNAATTSLVTSVFSPSINSSGVYTYTVDNGACGVSTSTVEVEVLQDNELTNVTIKVNDFSSTNNNIEVFVNSEREYEYSLDGVSYQKENKFNNLSGGNQKVYVRGVDGCEFYIETVFVKTYPTFFTPNNDGDNDFWQLKDFPNINYIVYIYNRFGKLIKEFPSNFGFWDGTYRGSPLESSDFWFKVVTENGEIYYGNFSLLRK